MHGFPLLSEGEAWAVPEKGFEELTSEDTVAATPEPEG